MMDAEKVVRSMIDEAMAKFLSGFEDRLAQSFQKALDTVVTEYNERFEQLEYDMARLLRHHGLERE